jgi:hypothetical protein
MHASVKEFLIFALATTPAWAKDNAAPVITPAQAQEIRAVKAEAALIQERANEQIASLIKELSNVYDALDKSALDGWCFIVDPHSQPQEHFIELKAPQQCDHGSHRIALPIEKPPVLPAPVSVPPVPAPVPNAVKK